MNGQNGTYFSVEVKQISGADTRERQLSAERNQVRGTKRSSDARMTPESFNKMDDSGGVAL